MSLLLMDVIPWGAAASHLPSRARTCREMRKETKFSVVPSHFSSRGWEMALNAFRPVRVDRSNASLVAYRLVTGGVVVAEGWKAEIADAKAFMAFARAVFEAVPEAMVVEFGLGIDGVRPDRRVRREILLFML